MVIARKAILPTTLLVAAHLFAARPSWSVAEADVWKVRRGDTLQSIAMSAFGTSRRWVEIFTLNRARISRADRIQVGQILRLKASAIDGAGPAASPRQAAIEPTKAVATQGSRAPLEARAGYGAREPASAPIGRFDDWALPEEVLTWRE